MFGGRIFFWTASMRHRKAQFGGAARRMLVAVYACVWLGWAFPGSAAAQTGGAAAETPGAAARQERPATPAAESRGKSVAPFIDDLTIGLVRFDLSQIDFAKVCKGADAWFLEEAQQSEAIARLWRTERRDLFERFSALRTLGVKDVFVLMTVRNLESETSQDRLVFPPFRWGFLVVPVCEGVELEAVRKELEGGPVAEGDSPGARGGRPLAQQWREATAIFDDAGRGRAVVAGSAEMLKHVAALKARARAGLTAALAAHDESPWQVVALPPPVFAQAAVELIGDQHFDKETSIGRTVAEGVRWASLGMVRSEDAAGEGVELIVQSADAGAAERLQRLISYGIGLLREHPIRHVPNVAKLAEMFSAKADGDRVVGSAKLASVAAGLSTPGREALVELLAAPLNRQSKDKLRTIALALHGYFDAKKQFPAPAIQDANGRPLLSWRVAVLPYLYEGGDKLLAEFRLDEAWDSEHNQKLIARIPSAYRAPGGDPGSGKTPYLAPVGEKLAFAPGKRFTIGDYSDGTSKTIFLVEVDEEHEIVWTKPADWEVDMQAPLKAVARRPGEYFLVACADASVRYLSKRVSREAFAAALTRNGGETLLWEMLER